MPTRLVATRLRWPWSQAPVALQQLALLKGFDLAGLSATDPEFVHIVVECAKLAFADREAFYGDPDFVDVPVATLLGEASWAAYAVRDAMAKTPEAVTAFIAEIAEAARPRAERDLARALVAKQKTHPEAKAIEVWDGATLVGSGQLVMPQLGSWDEWRDSSFVSVDLVAGKTYAIVIREDGASGNMSDLDHFSLYTGGTGGTGGRFDKVNVAEIKVLAMGAP